MWQYDLLGNGFDGFDDIFTDVKSSISDAIDNLREHFIYVPFHPGEIYYVLEHSHEFINGYAKGWYVVKAKVTEIRVDKTSQFEAVTIYLTDTERPGGLLCCSSKEYNKIFFKDEDKAKTECDKANRWLKSNQEKSNGH